MFPAGLFPAGLFPAGLPAQLSAPRLRRSFTLLGSFLGLLHGSALWFWFFVLLPNHRTNRSRGQNLKGRSSASRLWQILLVHPEVPQQDMYQRTLRYPPKDYYARNWSYP